MQNVLAAQCVAVVGPMQRAFDSVQPHPQARLRQRLGRRAEMVQQRLDLAPLDVSADRILKNRTEQVFVSATHGGGPRKRKNAALDELLSAPDSFPRAMRRKRKTSH